MHWSRGFSCSLGGCFTPCPALLCLCVVFLAIVTIFPLSLALTFPSADPFFFSPFIHSPILMWLSCFDYFLLCWLNEASSTWCWQFEPATPLLLKWRSTISVLSEALIVALKQSSIPGELRICFHLLWTEIHNKRDDICSKICKDSSGFLQATIFCKCATVVTPSITGFKFFCCFFYQHCSSNSCSGRCLAQKPDKSPHSS